MTTSTRLPISIDRAPRAADVAQVRAGLMAYNEAAVGPAVVEPVALYVRDDDGTIRGGLVGYFAWKWLYVDLLWVDEPLRGKGYGGQLLAEAERVARDAGCVAARLDTCEFQARPFYERHGYVVYGVLEGYPAGTRQYSMRKSLESVPAGC
jgi:GNAT superfamily N-acetyltransferase